MWMHATGRKRNRRSADESDDVDIDSGPLDSRLKRPCSLALSHVPPAGSLSVASGEGESMPVDWDRAGCKRSRAEPGDREAADDTAAGGGGDGDDDDEAFARNAYPKRACHAGDYASASTPFVSTVRMTRHDMYMFRSRVDPACQYY